MSSYRPNESGVIRDEANVREIAGQRPLGATRIQCEQDPPTTDPLIAQWRQESQARSDEREPSIRGNSQDNRCAEFNKSLRG